MIETLIGIVIQLIVLGVVFWILDYIVSLIPLFAPFRQVIRTVLAILALLCLLGLILSAFEGHSYLPAFR